MTQPQPTQNQQLAHPIRSPLVIGICGGIASGKSVVTSQLEKLGAAVIYADQIGHQVLREPEVIRVLIERFGDTILSVDEPGELSRAAIANLVFGKSEIAEQNRTFLNSITHPRIRQIIREQLLQLRSAPTPPRSIVLDVPLLFESGWYTECNEIIFVRSPLEQRIQRAASRGWNLEQFTARENSQLSLAEKEKRSSVILNNAGTLMEFQTQIAEWYTKRLNPSPAQ